MKTLLARTLIVALCAGTAMASPQETQTFAGPYGTYFDETNGTNTTLNATFTATGYSPVGVHIQMDLESVADGTWANDVRVVCTPPAGPAFNVIMSNTFTYVTIANATGTATFPAGVTAAGAWTFLIFDDYDDAAGGVESNVSNVRLSLDSASPPATFVNLGTLADGTLTRSGDMLAAGEVKWYKFTAPALDSATTPKYMDIHTAPETFDAVIAVYNNSGTRVGLDDQDGLLDASFLSFGYGSGPYVGDAGGAVSDGRDGQLAAGVYWLGVLDYGTGGGYLFNPNWNASAGATAAEQTFDVVFDVGNFVPPSPPSTVADLGTLRNATVVTELPLDAGTFKWVKFTTPADANDTTGYYVDIYTLGSVTTGGTAADNDTEVGVYQSTGALVASNDDVDYPADPTSAVSFGDGDPVRTQGTSTFAFDGLDRANFTAGTYYIATGCYNVTFGASLYNVATTGASAGTISLSVASNFPGACSIADVGVVGGGTGHDNVLDNNDFVAFINLFFAMDAQADVGVVGGGPGSDGLWDNNDFVAFINFFFNDQAACTG